jgi:hypothetical protein
VPAAPAAVAVLAATAAVVAALGRLDPTLPRGVGGTWPRLVPACPPPGASNGRSTSCMLRCSLALHLMHEERCAPSEKRAWVWVLFK